MNIRHIAKQAGVSVATVSRVLNHPENVAPKTREKIEKIIAEKEYTPNWFARGLNFNKTGAIGIMIPHILNSVHMEIAKGVEDVAHQKEYVTLMCNVENDINKERRYLELLIKRRVDGIIFICPSLSRRDFLPAREQGIPVVLIGEHTGGAGLPVISVDCRRAAHDAVRHLVDNGYRRIAMLYGEDPYLENSHKTAGYEQVLREAGLPSRGQYLREVKNSIEGGYLGAKKLLELASPPDAIFASSDNIAFGAMDAIKDKGLRIPEDIAVVGFDNARMSNMVEPKLTTVEVPLHKMGVYGARLLFDLMDGDSSDNDDSDGKGRQEAAAGTGKTGEAAERQKDGPKPVLLQTKLRIRKSSGQKERIGEMF